MTHNDRLSARHGTREIGAAAEAGVFKKPLVTIHGINSDGKWQEEVQPALDALFECVSLKYDEYRWRGELKLFLGTLAVPLVVVAMSLLIIFGVHWPVIVLTLFLSLVVISFLESFQLRRRVLRKIKRELDTRISPLGTEPHVLAHSLGTLLIGKALEHFPDTLVDRIVLTGSVLPSDFDWEGLYQKREPFSQVRNEVGGKDTVAWLAGVVAWLIRGLGDAGKYGFRAGRVPTRDNEVSGSAEEHRFVHEVDNEYRPCQYCKSNAGLARVHNVSFPSYSHSDHFIGRGHALRFWLPFFLGIEPQEYRRWLKLCSRAAEYEQDGQLTELRVTESVLRDQHWNWANASLKKHIEDQVSWMQALQTEMGQSEGVVDETVAWVWRLVHLAGQEQGKGQKGTRDLMQALNPRTAVRRAVNRVLSA